MTNDGKVYLIGLKATPRSYTLMQLQHDEFHGVRCLKGTARWPKNNGWIDGKRVYIPIEQIAAITEFDSWEEYLSACSQMDNESSPEPEKPAKARARKGLAKPKKPKKKR